MKDLEQLDDPRDGAGIMETARSCAFALVLVLLCALAAGLVMRKLPMWDEALDAQITHKHVQEATARKEVRPELALPILYDATVTQVNAQGELRTRFYSRSHK